MDGELEGLVLLSVGRWVGSGLFGGPTDWFGPTKVGRVLGSAFSFI